MLPLSLYIHFPWCVKKCPYCDFNSFKKDAYFDEGLYIQALIRDFEIDYARFGFERKIETVFMGGGTPSLFSGKALEILFRKLRPYFSRSDIEISLEANPGTIERDQFAAYFDLGINRISLGVQSFSEAQLKTLGRIHLGADVETAIAEICKAGFSNFNLDLMHGLPLQTLDEALLDLQTAISFEPDHLSWYQLTLEPNTYFANYPPQLPQDDDLALIEAEGFKLLQTFGYERYEISAFACAQQYCSHNLNYWRFGDYLGIGAGAHGKITDPDKKIIRTAKHKVPRAYLDPQKDFTAEFKEILVADQTFEFMLNALRLIEGFDLDLFAERTSVDAQLLLPFIERAQKLNLVEFKQNALKPSAHGLQFLNDLMLIFSDVSGGMATPLLS